MIREKVATYWKRLYGLSIAYNQVFQKQSPNTKIVLSDLAKFCRAYDSSFHPDPRMHAVIEGRREVWLRIAQYLQLTPEEIYGLHVIKEQRVVEEKNG